MTKSFSRILEPTVLINDDSVKIIIDAAHGPTNHSYFASLFVQITPVLFLNWSSYSRLTNNGFSSLPDMIIDK